MRIRDLVSKGFLKLMIISSLLFFGATALVVYFNYESYAERTAKLISSVVADLAREYLSDVSRVEERLDLKVRGFLPVAWSFIKEFESPEEVDLRKLVDFLKFRFNLYVVDSNGRVVNSLWEGAHLPEKVKRLLLEGVSKGRVRKVELSFLEKAYLYSPSGSGFSLVLTLNLNDALKLRGIPSIEEFEAELKAKYSFIERMDLIQLESLKNGKFRLALEALKGWKIKRLRLSWGKERIFIPLSRERKLVLVVLFHKTELFSVILRTIIGILAALVVAFFFSVFLARGVVDDIVSPIESLGRRVEKISAEKGFRLEGPEEAGERPEEVAKLEEAIFSLVESINHHISRLSETNERLMKLADVLLMFDPWVDEKKFMEEVLKTAMRFVPEADRGSIYVVEDGKVKCLAQVGYDDSIFGVEFKVEQLVLPDGEPKVIEGIADKTRDEKVRAFLKSIGSSDIKKTLCVGLFFRKRYYGGIFLDTTKEGVNFSQASLRFIKVFGKLVSNFITLKELLREERRFYFEVISVLLRSLELRDPYTAGHSERVAQLASSLAKRINLPQEDVEKVMWAGILHDVGKLGVPDSILNKPGKLSEEEFEEIKKHPVLSERLVKESSMLRDLAPAVRHHHERWDGKGYPDGLKGEEIPLWARIIALADAFDAMTSDRVYRKRKSVEEALAELEKGKGSQVDPNLADIFIEMIKETGGGEK